MTDLSYSELTGDIVVLGGDLALSGDGGQREVAVQDIRSTLSLFLGEWFLDNPRRPKHGVPYTQRILGVKGLSNDVLNKIMTDAILKDRNVDSVTEIDCKINRATRFLEVNFRCILKSGLELEEALTITI